MNLAALLRFPNVRQSLEDPRTSLSNPADWLWDAFGAAPTQAGIRVSEETALRYSMVYACVARLAETVGRLPCKSYRRTAGGAEPFESREAAILRHSPNPEMTSMSFWGTLMAHVSLWGNAYAEKQYDRSERLIALWPRSPDRTRPVRRDGRFFFETSDTPGGSVRIIEPEDMLHIPGLSLNGVEGLSPIRYAREAIALGLATEEYGGRFFANDSRPGGILAPKVQMTKEQRLDLQAAWERAQRGENRHRVAVMPVDMEWRNIAIPNDDAQFLETRKFQLADIARIFGVPAVLLMIDDKTSTYASAEQFFLSFVKFTIAPWLERFEQAIDKSIYENSATYAEFNVDSLLRGDFKSRQEGQQIERQNSIITLNEWRKNEGLNPLPPKIGDTVLVPANMVIFDLEGNRVGDTVAGQDDAEDPAVDDPGSMEPGSGQDDPMMASLRRLFRADVERVLGWSTRDAVKIARLFEPVLAELYRAIGTPNPADAAALAGAAIAARAVEWTGADAEAITALEFEPIRRNHAKN